MPCYQIHESHGRCGFLCMANEPVEIKHNGTVYRFEWTPACGWMRVNQDGRQSLTRVPNGAWDALVRRYPKWTDEKERSRFAKLQNI